MLIWILIVANIPVYLFIGWLVFDTSSDAADTFVDTIVAIVKRATFVSRLIMVLSGDDDSGDDTWGIFPILGFFLACAGVVYGEYWLVNKFF